MSDVNDNSRKLRLSDTQLIALSVASQREDGAVSLPDRIKGAAAVNLIASLAAKGLVHEVCATPGMPVARRDEEGRPFALVITELGRASINVIDETSGDREQENIDAPDSSVNAESDERVEASELLNLQNDSLSEEASTAPADMPREGSKLANVVGLLDRPEGASMDEIIGATTWLPHTARAALTGLRKRGFNIERHRADGVTCYRIVADDAGGEAIPHRPDPSASSTPTEGDTEAA
jgi:hypothetical protein